MKCTIASIVLLILATDAGARTFKLVDNQTSELGADDSRPQTEHEESIGPNALREALQRGEILPLQVIMAAVRARFPGEVIAIETERHGVQIVYEVKILGDDGRRRKIVIDAHSLNMMEK